MGLFVSEEPGPPLSVNVVILDQAQVSFVLSIVFHPEVLRSSSWVVQSQADSGFWDTTDPAQGRWTTWRTEVTEKETNSFWAHLCLSFLPCLWAVAVISSSCFCCPFVHAGAKIKNVTWIWVAAPHWGHLTWCCPEQSQIGQRWTLGLGCASLDLRTCHHRIFYSNLCNNQWEGELWAIPEPRLAIYKKASCWNNSH